jgi:hypothetical protein
MATTEAPVKPKFLDDYIKARDSAQEWADTLDADLFSTISKVMEKYRNPETRKYNAKQFNDATKAGTLGNEVADELKKLLKQYTKMATDDENELELAFRGRFGMGSNDIVETAKRMKSNLTPSRFYSTLSEALEAPKQAVQSRALSKIKTGDSDIKDLLKYTGLESKVSADKIRETPKMARFLELYDSVGGTPSDKLLKDNGYM